MTQIQNYGRGPTQSEFLGLIPKILTALDEGGEKAQLLAPGTRKRQAALDKLTKKRPPSLAKLSEDIDRRIERDDDYTAEQGIADLRAAREAIAKFAEDEEKGRLETAELKSNLRRTAAKEFRELEPELIECVNREVELFKSEWAKLPSGVHDDSSAMRARVPAVKAWLACGESYTRLHSLWSVATQLRAYSFIDATRTDGFAPHEYFYRYPDKVRGLTQQVFARSLTERMCSFADNIAAGAEPGLYTAAELRLFDQQDAAAAARARAMSAVPAAKKRPRAMSV